MDDNRLQNLKQFFKQWRRMPSYQEMLALFNVKSKNAVYKIIQKWIGQGILQLENHKLSPTSVFFQLPMLGKVKAGFPALADEDTEFLSLDEYVIDKPNASFLLTVDGDSLEGIGIYKGDLVVIEKGTSGKDGEIVLALIDHEWTLKILRKSGRQVFLESANPKYPPFYPKEELKIFGVMKAVIRKLH